MKNILISVLFLLTFLKSIEGSYNDEALLYCKERGFTAAEESDDCQFNLGTVKLPPILLKKCEEEFMQSCRYIKQNLFCIQGTLYALNHGICFDAQNGIIENKAFADCCKACMNGLRNAHIKVCGDHGDEDMIVNATNTCCHNGRFRRSTDVKPDSKEDKVLQNIIKKCGNKCNKVQRCENIGEKHVCVDDLRGEESNNEEIVEEPEMVDEDYGEQTESTADKEINSISNCGYGQKYNEVTKQCENDDLCLSLQNPCGVTMECESALGEFKCHMKRINNTHCPEGYKMGNRYCEDINECEDESKCAKSEVCKNFEGSYTCLNQNENSNSVDDSNTPFKEVDSNVNSCDEGFTLNDNADCEDIDECKIGTHNCQQGTTCKNTEGSFTCEQIKCEAGKSMNAKGKCVELPIKQACSSGFFFNPESNKCDDINECEVSKHSLCKENEECTNIPGSYKCVFSCGYGTKEMNGKCEDLDECKENVYECPENQVCVNKKDGYDCVLATISKIETTATVEIETTPTTTAIENILSKDTDGNGLKRNANCENGLTLNLETGLCFDLRCDDGFQFNNDTKRCDDIDECKFSEKACSSWQQCLNTNGSFLCEAIECQPGFEPNDNGECHEIKCLKGRIVDKNTNNCVDFNECESNPCEDGKECVNTIGSYECRELKICEKGLEKLMGQCIDIDECKRFQHNCSADKHEKCVNKIGSFYCACEKGFTRSNITGTCEDIDECFGINSCMLPKNHCKNTIGGHECVCPPGYKETNDDCIATDLCNPNPCPNSLTCVALGGTSLSYNCLCPEGFELNDNKTNCVDIDECQKVDSKYCDNCENTVGSFKCGCKHGRELRNDGGTPNCADINECLNENTCNADEICTNLSPGYRCTPTKCSTPYRREPHKPWSCFKEYSDKDKSKPLMLHYHAFALRSNHTVPKSTGLPLYTIHIKDLSCKFTHKLEKVDKLDVEVAKTTIKESWKLVEHGKESATLVLYSTLPGPADIEISVDCNAYGFIAHRTFVYVFISEN